MEEGGVELDEEDEDSECGVAVELWAIVFSDSDITIIAESVDVKGMNTLPRKLQLFYTRPTLAHAKISTPGLCSVELRCCLLSDLRLLLSPSNLGPVMLGTHVLRLPLGCLITTYSIEQANLCA